MTDLRKTAMDIAEASQTQWPDELADAIHTALEAARDEALEEAARVARSSDDSDLRAIAARIRCLKSTPQGEPK